MLLRHVNTKDIEDDSYIKELAQASAGGGEGGLQSD